MRTELDPRPLFMSAIEAMTRLITERDALVAEVKRLREALTLLVRTKACVSARNDANARRCIDWMPSEEWCSWCQALAALHPQEPSDG